MVITINDLVASPTNLDATKIAANIPITMDIAATAAVRLDWSIIAMAPRATIKIPKDTAMATNGPVSTPLANDVQAITSPIIIII